MFVKSKRKREREKSTLKCPPFLFCVTSKDKANVVPGPDGADGGRDPGLPQRAAVVELGEVPPPAVAEQGDDHGRGRSG